MSARHQRASEAAGAAVGPHLGIGLLHTAGRRPSTSPAPLTFCTLLLTRRHWGCNLEDCQLCKNNALKASARSYFVFEWKHVFVHTAPHTRMHVCMLISKTCLHTYNSLQVCEDAAVFDGQYWVRDDGKGGQMVRAKCGADVSVQVSAGQRFINGLVPGVPAPGLWARGRRRVQLGGPGEARPRTLCEGTRP